MRDLSFEELESIDGGIIPLIALGVAAATYCVGAWALCYAMGVN